MEKSDRDDADYIDSQIVNYNGKMVPFTQAPTFIGLNRVIKDETGNIIAGINTVLYCWNCLYIDVLWIKEEYRGKGLGARLLKEVEDISKDKGCKLVHLDTFDFQAKDFYIKQGYEIFGKLENCPTGHIRYFMKKDFE